MSEELSQEPRLLAIATSTGKELVLRRVEAVEAISRPFLVRVEVLSEDKEIAAADMIGQSAQVTISPEFTYCLDCRHNTRGLPETCPQCGSKNVEGETRVVGYFSKIKNWNKSKRYGELIDRQRGQYAVETAKNPGVETVECPPVEQPAMARV